MKRTLAILCVIACLFALCVPAMAAGNITVSVKAPDAWTEVYLYIWESEAYEGWPGTAMTKGDDGWWTLEVPAGYTNVIANNGNEKPQTVDLKMSGSDDAFITVTTDTGDGKHFNANVTADAEGNETFTPPVATFNSLSIVGDGILGLESWVVEASEGDFNLTGENVYTRILPVFADTTMKFKFAANHTWDVNFGGASADMVVTPGTAVEMVSGGQDLTFNADKDCNLKFTVTITATGATLLVEETEEEPDEAPEAPETPDVPAGDLITVYVKFPTDWSGAAVWAWDDGKGNATNAAWPGDLYLVQGDDGWWSVQVPNWVTGILINGNGGGVQTPDIKGFETGKDIWINAYTDYQNPVYSHEVIIDIAEPAQTEAPSASIRETSGLKGDDAAQNQAKGGQDLTVLLCIVGSVVIIAIAAVIFIVLKKKNNAA